MERLDTQGSAMTEITTEVRAIPEPIHKEREPVTNNPRPRRANTVLQWATANLHTPRPLTDGVIATDPAGVDHVVNEGRKKTLKFWTVADLRLKNDSRPF